MPVILKNNASSTLATAVAADETGLVVADGSQFPSPGAGDYFYATLVSPGGTTEIVKVTARSGNALTVVRAQDGSTANGFPAGTLVEMRVNAASVGDYVDEAVAPKLNAADLAATTAGNGASLVGVEDAGGYYAAENLEDLLQELGAGGGVVGVNTFIDNFTGDGSQTSFPLSKQPLSQNTLDVYIDGVYQNKTGFSFVGTVLTFDAPPPLGSSIEVTVNTNATAGNAVAANVTYTPAGTGAVSRTVQSRLRDFVSVKDFGAVGDGVADDTDALTNAIAAQVPLYFGDETYKITSPIFQTLTKDVLWEGRGGKIVYANSSHTEYVIRLSDTTGVDIVINDLTIDGSKQANKILEVLNNTSNATPTNFVANELRVDNCKRLNTFDGGTAISLRGAFEDITFNGGWVRDCELPTGQGTSGVVGIGGISVTWYSETSYARRVTLNGVLIEKVYSSDLSYTADQDGFKYFAPNVSGGTSGKVESDCVIMGGCRFVNCYGRAIKTQVRNTIIRDSHFQRTEGLSGGVGNGEIAAQSGSSVVESCTFSYSNSQTPRAVVAPSSTTGWKSGAAIRNNEVYLESGTVLPLFVQPFPSGVASPWTRMEVVGNKVLGSVEAFVDFLTNSNKAHLTVTDNWVEEVAPSTNPNILGERNLIYVRTSGATPPEGNYAYVNARSNVYVGSETVYLLRARVGGTQMDAELSAYDNFGFVDRWDGEAGDLDPADTAAIAARLTGLESQRTKGYFGMQTKTLTTGTTETFSFRANNASFIILQVSGNDTQFALFSVAASIEEVASGSNVAVGTTSNPGTGSFNVWRSGFGEISVENDSGATRTVSVWVFAPN